MGSAPHYRSALDKKTGDNALSRFYETFIAPNTIRFNVANDIVCHDRVVRDLTVTIDMGKVSVSVPMHLLYVLVIENNQIKISRLAAHWELLPMVRVLLSSGVEAMPVLLSLSKRMMKYQGVLGAVGFASGVGIWGERRKAKAECFFAAFNNKDSHAMLALLGRNGVINAPYGDPPIAPEALFQKMPGSISFTKLLVAGFTVSASIAYKPEGDDEKKQGVVIFEFDKSKIKIACLTFYYDLPYLLL